MFNTGIFFKILATVAIIMVMVCDISTAAYWLNKPDTLTVIAAIFAFVIVVPYTVCYAMLMTWRSTVKKLLKRVSENEE